MTKYTEKQALCGWSSVRWSPVLDPETCRPASAPNQQRPIVFRCVSHKASEGIDPHSHDWHQLLYAYRGVMQVLTQQGTWVVPPHRAVWIPAGVAHAVQAIQDLSLRNVYMHPQHMAPIAAHCCVVNVSPLLRELIATCCQFASAYDQSGAEGRLIQVLLDQLQLLEQSALHLPNPSDARLQVIANALLLAPQENTTLEQWAERMGLSSRSLARLFRQQTGMSFGQWRQQARLLAATVMLAEGRSVVDVSLSLGYQSQSAFIAMFQRATGQTPGRYFKHTESS